MSGSPRAPRGLRRVEATLAHARALSRALSVSRLAALRYLLCRRGARLRERPFAFRWRGHPFTARPADDTAIREVLLDGEYAEVLRLLAGAPARPVVIDGGANIGLFSLAVLDARPDAAVHSLEPAAATFGVLEQNARANPAFDWRPHRLALWREPGTVAFGAMAASTAGRIHELLPGGVVEMVPAAGLADFAARHAPGPIFLLKLDIEGAEEAVLVAGEAVLSRVEHAVVEIHPPRSDEARVLGVLEAHFPRLTRLAGRRSSKPLVLASRVPGGGRP
jgi:FkbM family methyltransferase